MQDHDGHDLQVGDIVHPDNATDLALSIVSFDGTIAYCRGRDAQDDPRLRYLPEHLVFIERP